MNALWEILQGRLVRRGVPTKNLTPGEIERAANDTVRRVITLQQGIPTEAAKRDRQVPEGPQAEESTGGHPGRPGTRLFGVEGRSAGGDPPATRTRFRCRVAVRQLPRVEECAWSEQYERERQHPAAVALTIVAYTQGTSARAPGGQTRVNADAALTAEFDETRQAVHGACTEKVHEKGGVPGLPKETTPEADRQAPAGAGPADSAAAAQSQAWRHLHQGDPCVFPAPARLGFRRPGRARAEGVDHGRESRADYNCKSTGGTPTRFRSRQCRRRSSLHCRSCLRNWSIASSANA